MCQLEELYKTAPQTGVKLVVIHSQTDVAEFVSRSPALFRNKTLCVVSMGGLIACPTEEPSPNSEPVSTHCSVRSNFKKVPKTSFCGSLASPLGHRARFLREIIMPFETHTLSQRSPAEVRETDHLHVDMNASNNIADMEAATFFTKECQALGVKMYVVSRHIV